MTGSVLLALPVGIPWVLAAVLALVDGRKRWVGLLAAAGLGMGLAACKAGGDHEQRGGVGDEDYADHNLQYVALEEEVRPRGEDHRDYERGEEDHRASSPSASPA